VAFTMSSTHSQTGCYFAVVNKQFVVSLRQHLKVHLKVFQFAPALAPALKGPNKLTIY